MKQRSFVVLCFLFASLLSLSQVQRPKLVIGIVIDQMRWDYLYRYNDRYSADGFKRILKEGFSCENTFIPYTPTYTAAGHTCVYTGSVPALHGIVGNNWYDKQQKKTVYCTDDVSVTGVGSNNDAGKMSPKNVWANTITDELRLSTNFRNKTIAIALKDRGAILPGGHTANAAYWFDINTGYFISSTYYMKALPDWATQFNSKKLPDAYLKQNWNTIYPIATYTQSTTDRESYEDPVLGETNVFPHRTDSISRRRYEAFEYTPYGNTITFDMARAAIEGEKLGAGNTTDFLAISCSSTDYIGHAMGPNSVEIEDTYLRLDKDLGAFMKYLDGKVGKGNYLLFLTADHGVAHVAGFAKENHLPAGNIEDAGWKSKLNTALKDQYNVANLIASVINYQVYFDDALVSKSNLDKYALKQAVISKLIADSSVARAFDLDQLQNVSIPMQVKNMLVNGYNQKLSGDVQFILKPQFYDRGSRGTTHGAWYPYDAHIPLLWYGWGIKAGKTNRETYMTDIAVTVAALLHVQMPNAAIGKVVEEVIPPVPLKGALR